VADAASVCITRADASSVRHDTGQGYEALPLGAGILRRVIAFRVLAFGYGHALSAQIIVDWICWNVFSHWLQHELQQDVQLVKFE
jgi:hypothetical protein